MASLRNRAQESSDRTSRGHASKIQEAKPCQPNPRGSSTKNAKKPRAIFVGDEVCSAALPKVPGKSPLGKRSAGTAGKALGQPQLEPIWEHTSSGWWVVEQNGMLRTGPFKDKEQARGWFYKELDIKLGI